jgi:hypothetical protein
MVTNQNDSFLWGLDELLSQAIRIALDQEKRKDALEKRIREIGKRLRGLRRDAEKERPSGGDSVRITEFKTSYGNSFKDL